MARPMEPDDKAELKKAAALLERGTLGSAKALLEVRACDSKADEAHAAWRARDRS